MHRFIQGIRLPDLLLGVRKELVKPSLREEGYPGVVLRFLLKRFLGPQFSDHHLVQAQNLLVDVLCEDLLKLCFIFFQEGLGLRLFGSSYKSGYTLSIVFEYVGISAQSVINALCFLKYNATTICYLTHADTALHRAPIIDALREMHAFAHRVFEKGREDQRLYTMEGNYRQLCEVTSGEVRGADLPADIRQLRVDLQRTKSSWASEIEAAVNAPAKSLCQWWFLCCCQNLVFIIRAMIGAAFMAAAVAMFVSAVFAEVAQGNGATDGFSIDWYMLVVFGNFIMPGAGVAAGCNYQRRFLRHFCGLLQMAEVEAQRRM